VGSREVDAFAAALFSDAVLRERVLQAICEVAGDAGFQVTSQDLARAAVAFMTGDGPSIEDPSP
jgi:hypothetical protein